MFILYLLYNCIKYSKEIYVTLVNGMKLNSYHQSLNIKQCTYHILGTFHYIIYIQFMFY